MPREDFRAVYMPYCIDRMPDGKKDHLQTCASSSGLAGRVVLTWQIGNNIKFIAPPEWHAFFKSISWSRIIASLNKTLTCR